MAAMILDLDLGNTRLKWRYSRAGRILAEGAVAHGMELPDGPGEPGRVRIATVVRGHLLDQLLASCRRRWQLEPELARVQQECAGVIQGYEDSSRLGVDRWLATLAAYAQGQSACVVVSCGTAVTVDLVSVGGEHLGGYIVPGIELMRSALFAGTSAVKLDGIGPQTSLEPGRTTSTAVSRGLLLMLKGLVENAVLELGRRGDSPKVVITGGDGEMLLPLLNVSGASTKPVYRPNLVLDGLALALP